MLDGNETNLVSSPCLVLAHPYPESQAVLARGFRRLGWDVYTAQSGSEARRLARMLEADMVILHVDLPEESGWLTCAKMKISGPAVRVVLYGPESPRLRRLAAFVGASVLLSDADAVAAWLRPYVRRRAGAC